MSGNAERVRDRLNDECEGCGKPKDEADEIGPITRGRLSIGPDWYCGECMGVEA